MSSPRQLFRRHILPRWNAYSVARKPCDGAIRLLVDNPPILHMLYWTDRKDPLEFLTPLQNVLRNLPLHIICSFSWDMDRPKAIERLAANDARRRKLFKRHRAHYLACTECQLELLSASGISTTLCSNTALVDEAIYYPIPGAVKHHDAIYDARLSPFKRHHLAEEVQSLALLTAPSDRPEDAPYAADIRRRLAHAHWCNAPFEVEYKSLGPVEVNREINEARVGLCLSATEGGMYASMQYLLAGLPVVSTPSVGGRDLFYHPDYAMIVEPTPAAVAEGVRRMAKCAIPPLEIRERTLEKVRQHRANLIALVDRICCDEGKPRQFAKDWLRVFVDKLAEYHKPFGRTLRPILRANPDWI